MIRKADWYEIDFEAVQPCHVAVGRGLQRATIGVPWFGGILRSLQREMTVENWATEDVKCGQFCQRFGRRTWALAEYAEGMSSA